MKKQTHYLGVLGALGLMALANSAQAVLVVDLQTSASNDWVTGTVNSGRTTASDTIGDFDGGGTNNDRRNVVAFDTSTPMFTGAQLGVQSGKFYGGKNNTFYNNTATFIGTDHRLVQGGGLSGVDRYLLGTSANPGAGNTQYAALVSVWKKDDFLSGGAGAQVNITADNAFKMQLSGGAALTARWLVQIGSTYYVSQESFTTDTDLVGNVFTSSAATTTLWAPIDLTANSGALTSAPGTYAGLTLENVQSLGIYASYSGGNAGVRWTLEAFSVDATVVPEPSALALLAGSGLLVLLRRRR